MKKFKYLCSIFFLYKASVISQFKMAAIEEED